MINLVRTRNSLMNNGFISEIFETGAEAREYFMNFIKPGRTVAVAGSVTLEELDIYNSLKEKGADVSMHWLDRDYQTSMMKSHMADFFVTSANAVTEDGQILMVDYYGNRISAVTFGKKKVFFFVGRNKIVTDVNTGFNRSLIIAQPQNFKRMEMESLKKNMRLDFDRQEDTNIMELTLKHGPKFQDTYVFLINEDLGY